MILGRVVGALWATRKHAALQQHKLLLVEPFAAFDLPHDGSPLVAVDTVAAGIGDEVVVCLGTPARRALGGDNLPVDAAIMAVVDRCGLDAELCGPAGSRPQVWRAGAPRRLEWT